jgi:replicative DNA helicase Mcm
MEDYGEDFVGYDETISRVSQFGTAYLRLAKKMKQGFVFTNEPGIYFIPALIDKWKAEKINNDFINFDKVNEYRNFGGIRLEDDLVNAIIPGDNVEVVGVLRLKKPQNTRTKKEQLFSHYIDVVSVRTLRRDFEKIELSAEDERRIKELAKDPLLTEKIINSIAPAIYGYREVKYAIALQLFGGTKGKQMKKRVPIRDDIHLLLIGDPGIAKTRFLQSVMEIAPKKVYVSGKSVSGVGLTVSVERDELSGGGWTLKAGALVLASGGIAAIDEFDKIDDDDRAALHEVMESQTVSVAKAGIVAKFRAKTAILAAANPRFGRFNPNKSLAEQFDIPPSLLSRFDLIFPIVDKLDVKKDEMLASHILNAHQEAMSAGDEQESPIPPDFLRKYIAYARRNIHPKLSDAAKEKIKAYYLRLRKMGAETGSVPITPRYLEGLVRLAEANAKMRLSNVVEEKDAEVAITLMDYVMDQIMTDKETGIKDIRMIEVGKPLSQIQKMEAIVEIIKELSKKYDLAEREKIIERAKEDYNMSEREVERILEELKKNGEIFDAGGGKFHLV